MEKPLLIDIHKKQNKKKQKNVLRISFRRKEFLHSRKEYDTRCNSDQRICWKYGKSN